MAFRRRFRRRFGGRRFGRRKEPIWTGAAYQVLKQPTAVNQDFFQLLSPDEYLQGDVESRRDSCTLLRTVGRFRLTPFLEFGDPQVGNEVQVSWKAAIIVIGEKELDDSFAIDPTQFNIMNPATFITFVKQHSPLHVFWFDEFAYNVSAGDSNAVTWVPPTVDPGRDWDLNVKRKLVTDASLYLLINSIFVQGPTPLDFGGSIDVESRVLFND